METKREIREKVTEYLLSRKPDLVDLCVDVSITKGVISIFAVAENADYEHQEEIYLELSKVLGDEISRHVSQFHYLQSSECALDRPGEYESMNFSCPIPLKRLAREIEYRKQNRQKWAELVNAALRVNQKYIYLDDDRAKALAVLQKTAGD